MKELSLIYYINKYPLVKRLVRILSFIPSVVICILVLRKGLTSGNKPVIVAAVMFGFLVLWGMLASWKPRYFALKKRERLPRRVY